MIWKIVGWLLVVYLLIRLISPLVLLVFYDIPLRRLRSKLDKVEVDVNERNRGRGIKHDERLRQIEIDQRPIKKAISIKEYKRKLLLDWIKTISTIQ